MKRLNVISDTAERELDAIRAKLTSYCSVPDLHGLVELLRAHAGTGNAIEIVDLVGHSSEGVLVLGTTTLDDSPAVAIAFTDEVRPLLHELGVRELRLLGCSTATTERGRAALRRISLATRCEVVGTLRSISRHDYGPWGFVSDGALVSNRAVAAFTRSRSAFRAQDS